MADISEEIAAFQNAVYGEDVRQAIINLANKLNNDLEAVVNGLATVATTGDYDDLTDKPDTLTSDNKITTAAGVNYYDDPSDWPKAFVHPAGLKDYVATEIGNAIGGSY